MAERVEKKKKQRRIDYDSCHVQASIMITCALELPYPVWHGVFLHQAASCPHIPMQFYVITAAI